MGIRPCDFEEMTFAEYCWAAYGLSQREILLQRQQWERTRWETWVLTSIQLEKKDRKPMDEMFPLPWDKENITTQTSQMSLEERRQRAKAMLNNTEK